MGTAGSKSSNRAGRILSVIATLLIVAALAMARDVLIPAALAILLAFLLQPVINRLRHMGLPKIAAVGITVLTMCAVTGGIGLLVGGEFYRLSEKLPEYRQNLLHKAHAFRITPDGALANINNTIKDIRQEMATSQPAAARAPSVALVDSGPTVLDILSVVAPSVLAPLTDAAIILLLLIFILLNIDDLRERLIAMAGARRISLTTAALNEAGQRVSRYLRTQLMINLGYGVMIGIGMAILNIPNSLFWGVMAGVLRFVPFLGPWIAGGLPTLLAIAIFEGWEKPIGVITTFAIVELITNTILEPWLYSRSSGITSLGVACAAVFWAWVWGPVGLILAVPLTVCLIVAGKYAPGLSVLNDLFGVEVEVVKGARFYRRMAVKA